MYEQEMKNVRKGYEKATYETKNMVDDCAEIAHNAGCKLGNAVAFITIAFVSTVVAIPSLLKGKALKDFINQNLMTKSGKKL